MPTLAVVHVGGDLLTDHHLYDGVRRPPKASETPTRLVEAAGGASFIAELLQELAKQDAGKPVWSADLLQDQPDAKGVLQSFAVWHVKPRKPDDQKEFVWRLSEPLGYGEPPKSFIGTRRKEFDAVYPNVIVLNDAGRDYRKQSSQSAWPAVLTAAKPESQNLPWIVLKMSAPLAQGDLWRKLRDEFRERLIVIVSIDDIRKEEIHVARGISWERTAADLAFELRCNPAITDLLNCRHLVVNFGSEGALHVARKADDASGFQLLYDAQSLEGESANGLEGTSVGFLSCLTSAVVRKFALLAGGPSWEIEQKTVRDGIRGGLTAIRKLREIGHGDCKSSTPGFPFAETGAVICELKPDSLLKLETVEVPAPDAACLTQDSPWAIITAAQDRLNIPRIPLYGVAARVARNGLRQVASIPHLKLGKLFTVDRSEIESLRCLQRLVVDYLRSEREERPLSLAVFGPPGAGKSFGVKQMAKAMYKQEFRQDAPILEFNLSQFTTSEELVGAFHAIRDKVLEGLTPVVFWDEFDSGEFKWLQNLLAPMQDGKFNEGQITHPIGKCIFVFAGGTSYDFDNFGPLAADDAQQHRDFRLKKGPDFKSRLSGYLNVLGPNPRLILKTVPPPSGSSVGTAAKQEWRDDSNDICFPIRRALLIRSALGLGDDEKLEMDSGILCALLETGHYRHGARSLEKIILQMKTHRDGKAIRRSALPPRELVAMHADYDELRRIANRDLQFRKMGVEMAPKIHEDWRRNKLKKLQAAAKPGETVDFKWNADFDKLPQWVQEENIAAAARIPRILTMVGLRVAPENDPANDDPDLIKRILLEHLEFLAEEEHDGWMDHKLRNGWTLGPRNDDLLVHDNLILYHKLTDDVQQYDRNSVENFPSSVQLAGFKVVRMGSDAKSS